MADDPVDTAADWPGVESLRPVWQELAKRMSASDRPVRTIVVTGLDERCRKTLASLLKLSHVPQEPAIRLSAAKLGDALGLYDETQLRCLVERVLGPIGNRAASRDEAARLRRNLWALAERQVGSRIPNTLTRIRSAGVPSSDLSGYERNLDLLARALNQLPLNPPSALPLFAWRLTGDPHSLDEQTTLGRFLQLAAVELAGYSLEEPNAVTIRRALQSVGVLVDRLSTTTITYGHRATQDSPLGELLLAALALKMPLNVSGTLLDSGEPAFLDSMWLCVENPSVVEAARLTGYNGPIVCTAGWPSTDTQRLLEIARSQNIDLRYAGDYDSQGLAIANFMVARFGARIDMTTTAYLAADQELSQHWGDAPIPNTPWDPQLADTIRKERRVVYQEDPAIWRALFSHFPPK